MPKPILIDAFCGGGGATRGYQQAGFYVVGVDVAPQPNYCGDDFIEADVFDLIPSILESAAVIHASPPCQYAVQWNGINLARNGSVPDHPNLIAPTRELLKATGLPYVIENVVGSELRSTLLLCGSMFGLGVRRHRLFESNVLLLRDPGCRHTGDELAIYGKLDGRRIWTRSDGSEVRAPRTLGEAQAAMGIDWMEWDELKESIPPAYCQFIGEQLMHVVPPDAERHSGGSSLAHRSDTFVSPGRRRDSLPNTDDPEGSASYEHWHLEESVGTAASSHLSNRGQDDLA